MPTLTVKVTDSSGNETVATHSFQTGGGTPLVGDVSGTFGDCFVAGDVNQTGDVFIEGLLTGIDTFHWQGNGFSVFFQDGGRAELHGKVKGKWGELGTGPKAADTTGWIGGDRIAIAPTAPVVIVNNVASNTTPVEGLWTGSWDTVIRPANASDVLLVNGVIAKPEVVNLSQSIVFENLSRGWHIHDEPGVFDVSDVKFLNCGTTGVLASYPVHFHFCGDSVRGSVFTRVVVEGGKNHAFVPHGSHGITFKDCVAYKTTSLPYWWDPPLNNNDPDPNESHDIFYDHDLAMWVTDNLLRQDGFHLGRGTGNRCIGSVATCIQGGTQSSGFQWPEVGIGNWIFQDCVSHNNKALGIFAWQNSPLPHVIEVFVAYRNGRAGILHGAYLNFYLYRDITLSNNPIALIGHALSSVTTEFPNATLTFEDVLTDGSLLISSHQQPSSRPVIYRRCTFAAVTYNEVQAGSFSYIIHEDSGLTPANFTLTIIQPQSVIEIKEGGVLTDRWANGVWS